MESLAAAGARPEAVEARAVGTVGYCRVGRSVVEVAGALTVAHIAVVCRQTEPGSVAGSVGVRGAIAVEEGRRRRLGVERSTAAVGRARSFQAAEGSSPLQAADLHIQTWSLPSFLAEHTQALYAVSRVSSAPAKSRTISFNEKDRTKGKEGVNSGREICLPKSSSRVQQ